MTSIPARPRVVGIIQVRTGSTRLPNKALADLAGQSVLGHVVERVKAARGLDAIVIATTRLLRDDVIAAQAAKWDIPVYRGPEEDVLSRYVGACAQMNADIGIRITADNPLADIPGIEAVVAHHLASEADYTHNLCYTGIYRYADGSAIGTGVEAFSVAALNFMDTLELMPTHRESVTCLMDENPERFRCERIPARPALRRSDVRLTLDTPEDLKVFRFLYERLYQPGQPVDTAEAIRLLDANPDIAALNRMHTFPLYDDIYKIQNDLTLRPARVKRSLTRKVRPHDTAVLAV